MNELEQRRRKLLHETRKTYSENYNPPAVHPRYRVAYHSLYPSEENSTPKQSGLLFRFVFALILFLIIYLIKDEDIFKQIVNLFR